MRDIQCGLSAAALLVFRHCGDGRIVRHGDADGGVPLLQRGMPRTKASDDRCADFGAKSKLHECLNDVRRKFDGFLSVHDVSPVRAGLPRRKYTICALCEFLDGGDDERDQVGVGQSQTLGIAGVDRFGEDGGDFLCQ